VEEKVRDPIFEQDSAKIDTAIDTVAGFAENDI